MMIVTVEGTDWFYTVEGQGEPVLFLHGGFDACANYSRLLAELAKDFRVFAVDRRGHGRTADTGAPFDHAVMAEELHALTSRLGLSSFHIVGYSDGANLGLHMASRFPQNVQSLVAISGNFTLSGMSEGWLGMLAELSVDFVREHMPEVLEQYEELNPEPDPETYVAKTRALWNQDVVISRERLSALRVRTLLVGGDRDVVPPQQLMDMHALIPDSSLLILPYCGHFVFQDFAYSATAASAVQIIKNFLATQFADHNADFI